MADSFLFKSSIFEVLRKKFKFVRNHHINNYNYILQIILHITSKITLDDKKLIFCP